MNDKCLRSKANTDKRNAKLKIDPDELAWEAEVNKSEKAKIKRDINGQKQKPSSSGGKRKKYSTDATMKEAVEEWFRLPPEQRKSTAQFAHARGLVTQAFMFTRIVVDDPKELLAPDARAGRESLLLL